MRLFSLKTVAFSVITLAVSVTAHATVVLDNLEYAAANGETDGTTIGSAFSTGSDALSLSSVIFPQSRLPGGADAFVVGEMCFINLRNADGTVGSVLFSNFTVSDGGAQFGNQTEADANVPFILAPNTSYYFSVSAVTSTAWDFSLDTTYLSRLGVTIPPTGSAAYKVATIGGAKTYFTLDQGPQLIYVVASAVPEPSSLCLFSLAGLGAFVMMRRARSATKA